MLAAHGLTYRPPARDQPLWSPLEFDTADARLVLLSGRSGAGKSTFLRILCGLLPGFRGGEIDGRIKILGRPAPRRPDGRINLLFQNTDAMLHSPRVADELLARAQPESGQHSSDLRHGWLAELIEQLELTELLERKTVELSGGQQQRVAFAAALASRPEVVLLDESTSNLDPHAAGALVKLVTGCVERFGTRFVAAEHRPEHLLALVDGAIHLNGEGGRAWSGPAGKAPPDVLPEPLDLAALSCLATASKPDSETEPLLTCRNVSCRRSGRLVLSRINLQLHAGEIVGLTGSNGAGKSTLLLLLAGGLKPTSDSQIDWSDRIGRRGIGLRAGLLLQKSITSTFLRHGTARGCPGG